jgi:large repetitive protein
MLLRFHTLATASLVLAVGCAGGPSPTTGDPGDPGDPGGPGDPGNPADPVSGRPLTPVEQKATALGVTIMSSDASGAPRLIRAVVPRAGRAGVTAEATARDHVAALASLWVQDARPMALLSSGTQQLRNGASVAKFAQHIDGIPVSSGELRVLMHADGSFAAVSGTLLPSTKTPIFVSSPRQALEHALDKQFGASRPQVAISDAGESRGWQQLQVSSTPELQVTSARARRELAVVNDQLVEVWAVEVEGNSALDPSADLSMPTYSSHRYLVADIDGRIIRDLDLVQSDAFVYRGYFETTGNRRPLDGPLESFAPHPTGVPDGSTPGLIPSNLVVMEAFNGPVDPWLASNATTTSGNNAEAFADLDGNDLFGPGDVRPEVRSGRVLNFTYNHELEPLATPNQSKAGTVNSFFLVNWMHDWWYDSGFTEATGNAQADNFGRGGIAGDAMLVAAQSGANAGSRNNANMSTPADGGRPRMHMFLWTAGTLTSLQTPAGPVQTEPFAAGPRDFDLTGEVVAATDATDPTTDACQPVTSDIAGKIALVTYSGVCGSAATVASVKAAGAVGVILSDGQLDNPRAFAGNAASNIPGVAIGKTDGETLRAAIAGGPVVVDLHSAKVGVERDGDLDNGVVAHEWGHYLHHRLADCGALQCAGMSEGWGDFNALMMMVREDDNREGVYAMAPYALNDGVTPDVAYFGIRRFPYSRDRTKNDLSFRHIGDENPLPTTTPGFPGGANSEVHATGEIWATMMWEAFNVVADAHGVNVARRRVSDYIVGGLLMAPPDATFTEQRDAILAATSAFDTDDMILIAAAFAGRGAGSCAVSPSNDSQTNAGVVESGTLAGKLAAGALSLTDDGNSCDGDGYLDPGESGQLRLTLANNGILAAENVSVTATTTNTGVQIGDPIQLPALQPFTSSSLAIPVTLLPTAPPNTVVTIRVHVAGEDTCDPNGVDVDLTVRTGVDDVPDASSIDHAETRISPWTPTGDAATDLWGRVFDATFNQSFFGKDAGFPTDTQFVSPPLNVSTTDSFVLSFSHAFSLEGDAATLFDGGVVELSLDGGATWSDVSEFGVDPGYTGALFVGSDNPIGGRLAYSGISPGFPTLNQVSLDFGTVFAGLTVQVRFRIGTDAAVAFSGWTIDDVEVDGITNTPFPIQVPEAAACTALELPTFESDVLATSSLPATSLSAFDRQVCILNDTP